MRYTMYYEIYDMCYKFVYIICQYKLYVERRSLVRTRVLCNELDLFQKTDWGVLIFLLSLMVEV